MSKGKDFIKQEILKYEHVPFNTYEESFASYKRFIGDAAKKHNLTCKQVNGKKFSYLLAGGKQVGKFTGLKPSSTGSIAFQICSDKFRLENFLRIMQLPVLTSQNIFEKSHAYELINNDHSHNYVLKPVGLAGGDGIELNIDSANFSEAWDNSIKIQKAKNVAQPSCIVQPYINGFDIRISIIEGRFVSALLRLPPNIVGDGEQSIEALIDQKNKIRAMTPYFRNKLIPIDLKLEKRLAESGLDIDSVPQKGEVLILNDISNLTLGGDSIDVTDEVSDDIKQAALEATAAIPELYSAGVDMMSEDFRNGGGQILEINTNANYTMHHVPLKGEPKYPFDILVQSILIKYKTGNGLSLTEEETKILKDITRFNTLKSKKMTSIFELTNI